jgi:hypothetical protein
MTLPANIRVNVGAPFPSLVKGSGPLTIQKANGIWTVGYNVMLLAQGYPATGALPTDYVYVYDSVAQTAYRMSLGQLGVAGTTVQRAVTAPPVTIGPTDQILHLNINTPTTIQLPSYTTRNGVPLTFKDVGAQATANPQTIVTAAGEFIDLTYTSASLNVNGQAIRLVPANDGVNAGWFRE